MGRMDPSDIVKKCKNGKRDKQKPSHKEQNAVDRMSSAGVALNR